MMTLMMTLMTTMMLELTRPGEVREPRPGGQAGRGLHRGPLLWPGDGRRGQRPAESGEERHLPRPPPDRPPPLTADRPTFSAGGLLSHYKTLGRSSPLQTAPGTQLH